MAWRIEVSKYPPWHPLAGQKRYSVVDALGNVACTTNIPEYANGYADCLNCRVSG